MDMPPDAYRAITSIFTNDSDLIVYGFDNRVRVVQINEMVRDDDERGSTLSSLEYCKCYRLPAMVCMG